MTTGTVFILELRNSFYLPSITSGFSAPNFQDESDFNTSLPWTSHGSVPRNEEEKQSSDWKAWEGIV